MNLAHYAKISFVGLSQRGTILLNNAYGERHSASVKANLQVTSTIAWASPLLISFV
jgi:hypothetical protein